MRRSVLTILGMIGVAGLVPAAFAAQDQDLFHQYKMVLEERERILSVEVQLERTPVHEVYARRGDRRDLRSIETCDGRSVTFTSNRSFVLPDKTRCFRYVVELKSSGRTSDLTLQGESWVSSPTRFMWLPRDSLAVRVELDSNNVSVSLPWQRDARGWWIYPSPQSGRSIAVFGGIPLSLGFDQPAVLISARSDQTVEAKLTKWLRLYLQTLEELVGEHFSTELQLIVIDTSRRGSSPVPFGHVVRDQGQSVRFFVDTSARYALLEEDWTAPHELAHLLLPYVDARWLSEGFASYYQNILMARAGTHSEVQAWSKLKERFSKAAREGRYLTPKSGRSRLLTYWSGAALAFRLDVELRQRGSSLDLVLQALAACCLPARQSWSATRFVDKLDELSGFDLARPLLTKYQAELGMPPTEDLFVADLAPIRANIMAATQPQQD